MRCLSAFSRQNPDGRFRDRSRSTRRAFSYAQIKGAGTLSPKRAAEPKITVPASYYFPITAPPPPPAPSPIGLRHEGTVCSWSVEIRVSIISSDSKSPRSAAFPRSINASLSNAGAIYVMFKNWGERGKGEILDIYDNLSRNLDKFKTPPVALPCRRRSKASSSPAASRWRSN